MPNEPNTLLAYAGEINEWVRQQVELNQKQSLINSRQAAFNERQMDFNADVKHELKTIHDRHWQFLIWLSVSLVMAITALIGIAISRIP